MMMIYHGPGGRSVVYTIVVVDGDVNEDGVVDEEKEDDVGGSIIVRQTTPV